MEKARYNRQMILPEIGELGQEKLSKAKVLIVGVGGLGSAILPYLVASGVGEIGIVDDDVIAISNLQRQVIFKTSSVGKSKVLEAKEMALALNPNVKINAIQEKLNPKNALQLLEGYDILVDATDNLNTKYLINDACCVLNKPFVYGSVFRFEGQVSVFNYKNGPTYRCLFPKQESEVLNCNDAGVLGIAVGIIGMLQANEVLKIILQIGEVLSNKLLVFNILNNEQQKFEICKNEENLIDLDWFKERYNNEYLSKEIEAIEVLSHINNNDFLFLDVRNFDEEPKLSFKNAIQIPLNQLELEHFKIDVNKQLYVYCQSGNRSLKAIEILKKHNFINAKSIIGGAKKLDEIY